MTEPELVIQVRAHCRECHHPMWTHDRTPSGLVCLAPGCGCGWRHDGDKLEERRAA